MQSIDIFFRDNKRIVPVIALPDLDAALPLADTLAACGFTVLEITLRTSYGIDAIRTLREQRPQLIVGAGTVKNVLQQRKALDVGAQFIVSPGLDMAMIELAHHRNIPLVPGIMTASELMTAENAGLPVVKLFPASLAGGTDFIDAMSPVFPQMKFFPTGGISEENVGDYLARSNVVCAGGSWLTPAKLLQQHDWVKLHSIASRC